MAINPRGMFWLNLACFQLAWFLSVSKQNDALLWVGALLVVQLVFSPSKLRDLSLLLSIGLLGIALDLVLTQASVFIFSPIQSPWWLALLWFHFALALNYSLGWLSRIPLPLAMLVSAIAGPFSYAMGYRLDAVEFGLPLLQTLLILSLCWALSILVFLKVRSTITQLQ
ncbi:DUF2878 domain-containing protein [Alginatibacterium sediminis]|uniref:DUF2878 domain-containing protein n=1 Tax=Alginatibacterium sediminis TaxID=2164068 RepID=A0A420E8N1_9ALTE|nr:DUF2878 domain-containing protein [Alginatibacterium sediminis]RKF15713.1 DUF2878 domain-containing protein [Alginatibacterium sediminis]